MRNICINDVEPSVGLVFSFVLNNDNAQLSGPNRHIIVFNDIRLQKDLEPLTFISDDKRNIGG